MSFKAVGYRQFYIHIVVLEALVSGVRCQVLKTRVSLKPLAQTWLTSMYAINRAFRAIIE